MSLSPFLFAGSGATTTTPTASSLPAAGTVTIRPPKMGKKKSDIYSCFQILPMKNKANKSIFMCKFCDRQYLQNATKMESHIVTQCQKVPPDIRLSYAKVHGGGPAATSTNNSSSSSLLITRRPSPATTSSPDSNSTCNNTNNLDDNRPNTPINLSQFAAANRSRLNQNPSSSSSSSNQNNRLHISSSAASAAANSLLQQFQQQQQQRNFNGMKRSSGSGGATVTRISTINNNNGNHGSGNSNSLLKKPKMMMNSMEAAAGTVLARRGGGGGGGGVSLIRQDNSKGNYSSRLIGPNSNSSSSSNGGGLYHGGNKTLQGRGDPSYVNSRCGVILKKTSNNNSEHLGGGGGIITTSRGNSSAGAAGNAKGNINSNNGSGFESHTPFHQLPMDHKELIEVWKLLARALYSSGCGLNLFENDFFKGAFKRLRPSFTLPTTYALANTLLGEEYLRLKHKIDNQINKCNFVTVQCQLLTRGDVSNEQQALSFYVFPPCMEPNQSQQIMYRIVPLTLATRDENLLSNPSKSTKETLTSIITSTVEDIGAHKVLAFVSSPCLSFAYDKLRSTFPGLIAFSCVFESLISLLDGFLEYEPVSDIAAKGKFIVDQTKRSVVLKKKFQEIQRQLKLPPVPGFKFSGKSKYSSLVKCLALLTSQKTAFRQLCEGEETKNDLLLSEDGAASFTVNEQFWNELDSITNVVVPLSNWIKIMEPECSPSISLVPQVFHELKKALLQEESLPGGTNKEFLLRLQSIKAACLNELHYAACLLNPKIFSSKKEVLPENEEEEGAEFIHYFCGTREFDVAVGLQELHQYRNKQGCFSKDESNKGMWELAHSVQDPVSWWKTLRPAASLSHVAMSLLNISACVHPHPDAADLMCFNNDEVIVDQEQQEKLAFLKCHLQKSQVVKKPQDSHFCSAGPSNKRSFGNSRVEQSSSSGQSTSSLFNLRDRGSEWSAAEMELCNQQSEFPIDEDPEPMDVTQFLLQSQGTEPEPVESSDSDNSDAEDVKDVKIGIEITNGCLSKSSSGSSSGGGGEVGAVVGSSLSVLGSKETATRRTSLSPPPKIKIEVKNEPVEEEDDTMIDEDETDPPPSSVQQEAPPNNTGDDDDDDSSSSSSDSSDDSSSSSSSSSSSNSNTESKA